MKKTWKIPALILGVVFDILFWKRNPGISFAIFVSLCLLVGYLIAKSAKISAAKINLLLLIPIFFFSVMTFIRRDPFTTLLNYAIVVAATGILTITFQSGSWIHFNITDYILNFFRLAGNILKFPLFSPTKDKSDQSAENETRKINTFWPILRGILLAIPVLFIFIALFSSADLIFNQRIHSLFANLNIEMVPEYIFRGIYILLIANFLAGIFLHAASESQKKELVSVNKPFVSPFLGFTEATVVFVSVLLLFFSFISIQFRYFFFGTNNISQTGFTFAEYARRGFSELVSAAIFSLILLLCLNAVTKRNDDRQRKVFSILFIGLVCSVVIILISSFQRLLLYEAAYGFSQLRTYSHVFMVWLGILLLAVVIMEIKSRPRIFGNIALLVLTGFAASLNFLNVDAFISHQNISRAEKGNELDVSYLTSLTNDAVPIMVKALLTSNVSLATKDGIGAALVCFQIKSNTNLTKKAAWQSFHFSDWKAIRELNKVSQQIGNYKVHKTERSTVVISPTGIEYSCQNFFLFD